MRLRFSTFALFIFVFCFCASFIPFSKVSAHHCASVPGARHPTDQEIQGGALAGRCYRPTDKGLSAETTQAKQYLLEKHNACSNGEGIMGRPGNDCILGLNDTFATKLAQLFKSNPQGLFGDIKIISGLRTEEGNEEVGGAEGSNHLTGCAVDLRGSRVSKTTSLPVHKYIASKGSTLGLRALHIAREYNHFELAGNCPKVGKASPKTTPSSPTDKISAAKNLVDVTGSLAAPTPPPPVPVPRPIRWGTIPSASFEVPTDPPAPAPGKSALSTLLTLAGLSPAPYIPPTPAPFLPAVVKTSVVSGLSMSDGAIPKLTTITSSVGATSAFLLQTPPPIVPNRSFLTQLQSLAQQLLKPF